MKDSFVQNAREAGWSVYVCDGEADVTIGGLHLADHDFVVSGGSDLLFYASVASVLRPMKRGLFHLYRQEVIFETLKLRHVQWQTLGIVSGNDYDNIRDMGIIRNFEIIRKIAANNTEGAFAAYLQSDEVVKKNKLQSSFANALNVFVKCEQTLVSIADEEQQVLENFDKLKEKLKHFSRQSKRLRKEIMKRSGKLRYDKTSLCC